MTNDIESRADIEKLMRVFYNRAMNDPELGPKFSQMNLEQHIPHIVDFWQSTGIGGAVYTGSPFAAHVDLQLGNAHFELWLRFFEESLRTLFAGPNADQILSKAQQVATMFRFQLGLMT